MKNNEEVVRWFRKLKARSSTLVGHIDKCPASKRQIVKMRKEIIEKLDDLTVLMIYEFLNLNGDLENF